VSVILAGLILNYDYQFINWKISNRYAIKYANMTKIMANPNWRKGISGNPKGRTATTRSIRTVKGMIENFVKRNITPNKLQKLYDSLTPKDRLTFLTEVLPYCAAKLSSQSMEISYENLSDKHLEMLYQKAMAGACKSLFIQNPILRLSDAVIKDDSIETIKISEKMITVPQV
jgi:hypothetical protein